MLCSSWDYRADSPFPYFLLYCFRETHLGLNARSCCCFVRIQIGGAVASMRRIDTRHAKPDCTRPAYTGSTSDSSGCIQVAPLYSYRVLYSSRNYLQSSFLKAQIDRFPLTVYVDASPHFLQHCSNTGAKMTPTPAQAFSTRPVSAPRSKAHKAPPQPPLYSPRIRWAPTFFAL